MVYKVYCPSKLHFRNFVVPMTVNKNLKPYLSAKMPHKEHFACQILSLQRSVKIFSKLKKIKKYC